MKLAGNMGDTGKVEMKDDENRRVGLANIQIAGDLRCHDVHVMSL